MQDDLVLLEHKDCGGKSITLHEAWFTKVIQEASQVSKTPVLVITFGSGLELYALTRHDYDYFKQMLEAQRG